MSYTVLARRYRSRTFEDVVGQEAIARTLRNAIATNRVAHAYLFCGTRGVGKTSMARIFAKALNGSVALEGAGEEGGGLLPGMGRSARGGTKGSGDGGTRGGGAEGSGSAIDEAIMQGRDTDVIEIDAASNRGIEEARELIANSVYRPLRGRYKIYIIDEVHMLTRESFNALLKTMEEPPEHVKFILCTTEPHKVPATIQSRCQRFDFRPIAASLIAGHLERVLEQEGVRAEPELLRAVARLGNGSMRDALSILDRLLASGEKRLTLGLLRDLLGLPAPELVSRVIDAAAAGDAGAALQAGDALIRSGASLEQAVESLLERLHDLMVLAACGSETDLVDLGAEARAEEAARAAAFDAAGLVHMIALCESVQRACRSSSCPRALFDAMLVRLAMTERLADVTAVVAGSTVSGGVQRAGASGRGAGTGAEQAAARIAPKKR